MIRTHERYTVAAVLALIGLVFMAVSTPAHAADTGELLPVADGTYSDWLKKPTSAIHHFSLVDESVCNGKTDGWRVKNNSSNNGKRNSVEVDISSIPVGSTITDIVLQPCASRNNKNNLTGSSVLDVFYRLDGVDSADAGGYVLPAGSNTPIQLGTTTYSGLTHTVTGSSTLEIGTEYESGNRGVRVSRMSAIVFYDAPLTPPAAPTNLTGFATSTGTTTDVFLTWDDNASNELSFHIERAAGTSTAFTLIGINGSDFTDFTNFGVSTGLWSYRVKALNTAGSSAYSNTAFVNVF